MIRRIWIATTGFLLIAGMAYPHVTHADFEVTAPDGRRVLLKDNGTWAYVETKDKAGTGDKAKTDGELLLLLERKIESGQNCRLTLQLVNKLPYEVASLVLHFSAYRPNGVLYATATPGSQFGSLRPGNSQVRQVEFQGIGCQDIARVQVGGGDRCTMGELHRWLDQDEYKGKCLARVRVVESNLLRFEK